MESATNLVGDTLPVPIDVAFKDIVYDVQVNKKDKDRTGLCDNSMQAKTILHGVSGVFKGGQLTAIMGSSGAGKTTLLNILSGRIVDFKGQLYANEKPYNFEIFGDFANYVMQTDVLMQTLTVRETLMFAAKLKITDENLIQSRMINLTKKLKLEKCLDVVVGGPILKGVSGGEKKRTSIAFELMSNPQVVALDEPTSGMDSLTSYIIVNELKDLVKEGKTIFLTIHQPNSQIYELFDNILLMVEGRIIYQGKTELAESYFADNFNLQCPQNYNPADYFISIMHHQDEQNVKRYPQFYRVYRQKLVQKVDLAIQNRQKRPIPLRIVQTKSSHNLKVLLQRDYLNILRNPMVLKVRIIQLVFMAIFTGGLYFNAGRYDYTDQTRWTTITGYLYFCIIDLYFQAMMPVALVFPTQRLVFLKQENSKMYGVVSYFMSRNIVEIPYLFFVPAIYMVIIYWMIGLGNSAEQFFTMYLILFLISFGGTSTGLMAGSMLRDEKAINAVIPLIALPLILFSGFFKNSGNMPDWIGWIQYISPFKYGFIGFVHNEVLYKQSLIAQLNFDVDMWPAIIILLALGIGMRIISFFFLWLKKSRLQ